MARQRPQHLGELGAREPRATKLHGHAELQKSALTQQREIGTDELIHFVAAALLLGQPGTKLGQHAAPIGLNRLLQGMNRHGMLLLWNCSIVTASIPKPPRP